MFFRQIYEEGLAQASYIVGWPETGTALVVDPRRDVDVYLDAARDADVHVHDRIARSHLSEGRLD